MGRMNAGDATGPLLSVRDVSVTFAKSRTLIDLVAGRMPAVVRAVRGVSFELHARETLGLVGESGSGKTTLGRMLLQLNAASSGQVLYRGRALTDPDRDWQRRLRREIQMVFQDPYSSLNPRMTVADTLAEVLQVHHIVPAPGIGSEVDRLMSLVGLHSSLVRRLPRSLSGGQRQRVGLARALAMRPSLLVLDEPVAALDVSIQAQILNLLADLAVELGLTMVFVAHDLSVVKHVSTRVAVMYQGQLVEVATRDELFRDPRHPYTKALLAAVPGLVPRKRLRGITPETDGRVTTMTTGCSFAPRCARAEAICQHEAPRPASLSVTHQASCHFA